MFDRFAVPKTYITRGCVRKPVRKHVDSQAKKLTEIENDTVHFGDSRPKVDITMSNRIKTLRAAKEWTQKDLALRAGVKVDIIKDYESGNAVPNGKLIRKFETILEGSLR